jgi:hypothetical protein
MAIVELNPMCKSRRRTYGGLVLRRYGNKVFLSCKPVFRNRRFSKAQLAAQERFRQAAFYATRLMADPRVRKVYEEEARVKRKPARSLIIADFLGAQRNHIPYPASRDLFRNPMYPHPVRLTREIRSGTQPRICGFKNKNESIVVSCFRHLHEDFHAALPPSPNQYWSV